MIEHSTFVISTEAKEVHLFLLKKSKTYFRIQEVFKHNKHIIIHEISFLEKKLLDLKILNFRLNRILLKADFIFFHNINLINALKKFKNTKPVIFFFHTDKLKSIKKFAFIDYVLTVNKKTKEIINSKFKSKKAYHLPNCISFEGIRKINSNKINKKKFTVGTFGRLVEKKGYEFLIEVFKKLPEIDLVIGGTGPINNRLLELSKGYKNIKLVGWIYDKKKFFSQIDLFSLPSTIEPFGLVILEAMAHGVPVISTDCRGPSDIIKHNYNGIIIKKNDISALIYNINLLKKKIDLRNKISKNGIATIKLKYTRKVYKKNLFSFLVKVEKEYE